MRKAQIDRAIQNVVPKSLPTQILESLYNSFIAGHPAERRMYALLRREFFWHHMLVDAHTVVNNGTESPRLGTKFIHQREFELFPRDGSLQLEPMDILEPLPRTKPGNYFIVIMTDRCTMLTGAISTTKIASIQVASMFFNNWIIP